MRQTGRKTANTYERNKSCKVCGKPIPDQSRKRSYCSERCQRRAFGARWTKRPTAHVRLAAKPHVDRALSDQGCRCVMCGWHLAFLRNHGLEVHHIRAVKDGGTNDRENLVVLCPNCHKAANWGFYTDDDLCTARRTAIADNQRDGLANAKRIAAGLRYLS